MFGCQKNIENMSDKKEEIAMTLDDGTACMNCALMEIGEVDPQFGRCEDCGKTAANYVLNIS